MNAKTNKVEKEKLDLFLKKLVENVVNPEEGILDLVSIYSEGRRHSYSDLANFILELKPEERDYLSENLERIYDVVKENPDIDNNIIFSFDKLYDHLNLEITRVQYYTSKTEHQKEIQKNMNTVEERIKSLRDELHQAEAGLSNAAEVLKSVESIKTELVTILGIFAATLLAFTGGINFLSGVLNSMSNSSIYKVSFIAAICGFVVYNTVICLMYIVTRIVGKQSSLFLPCKTADCSCQTKCSLVEKIKNRMPYVHYVNVLFIVIMVAIGILWSIDFHKFVKVFVQPRIYS